MAELTYLKPEDVLPEGWQSEDEGFVVSDYICEHTWLEARYDDKADEPYWWSELWLTPDKCEGETHNEGYDVWGDTAHEVIEAIGPLKELNPMEFCHYCSGRWPLPEKEEE
jgi:hypothetical protein